MMDALVIDKDTNHSETSMKEVLPLAMNEQVGEYNTYVVSTCWTPGGAGSTLDSSLALGLSRHTDYPSHTPICNHTEKTRHSRTTLIVLKYNSIIILQQYNTVHNIIMETIVFPTKRVLAYSLMNECSLV